MNKLMIPALLTTLLFATSAYTKTYEWHSGLCDYRGEYDEDKYTLEQIQNSHALFDELYRVKLDYNFLYIGDNIDGLTLDNIKLLDDAREYLNSEVKQLDVVPQAEQYRQNLLDNINDEYTHGKLKILAFLDAQEAYKQSPDECKHQLIPLLEGETETLNRWDEMIENELTSYEDLPPEDAASLKKHLLEKYHEQKNKNPIFYAKKHIIYKGFLYCINDLKPDYRLSSEISINYKNLNKSIFGSSYQYSCYE